MMDFLAWAIYYGGVAVMLFLLGAGLVAWFLVLIGRDS